MHDVHEQYEQRAILATTTGGRSATEWQESTDARSAHENLAFDTAQAPSSSSTSIAHTRSTTRLNEQT